MNEGKLFETDFKNSIPPDTYYLRIHDNPQSFNQTDNLRFSPKNPYDALMYIFPNLFTLELKTTIGTSFSFNGKTPMIKKHQIEGLDKSSKHKGIISGFIFNFRKVNKTYFLPIDKFLNYKNSTDKKSINQKDIIDSGAIEVRGEIKRVRTKFYIGEFIKKVQE